MYIPIKHLGHLWRMQLFSLRFLNDLYIYLPMLFDCHGYKVDQDHHCSVHPERMNIFNILHILIPLSLRCTTNISFTLGFEFIQSHTLPIPVGNPFTCKVWISMSTLFTTILSSLFYYRLKLHCVATLQCTLRGICPHSTLTITVLIVVLTCNTHRAILRKHLISWS